MARAILARRTASSAVRAPEVLGRIKYFSGSSTERMLSVSGWPKSTRRRATVTISALEASRAAFKAAVAGNFPVPTMRRERKVRPAMIKGSFGIIDS